MPAQANGIIDPDLYYTLEGLAKTIGVAPSQLREQINEDELLATYFCKKFIVPGWAFAQWIDARLGVRPEKQVRGVASKRGLKVAK